MQMNIGNFIIMDGFLQLVVVALLLCLIQMNPVSTSGLHNESCFADSECPREMRCRQDDDFINLCVCQPGYTFSNPFARCEPSKEIFQNFWIDGPSIVFLPQEEIRFQVKFGNQGDNERVNWRYEWLIQDGGEFANFSGLNTSTLLLTELENGFIIFGVSITKEDAYGYMSHNLTIIDTPKKSVKMDVGNPTAIASNLTVILPTDHAVFSAIGSKNVAHFKWMPFGDTPAALIIGKPLNESELFITNLVPGIFCFNLTVSNTDFTHSHTITVELLVVKGNFEHLIEILLNGNIDTFTMSKLNQFTKTIEKTIMEEMDVAVRIQFKTIREETEGIKLIFIVEDAYGNTVNAMKIAKILRESESFQRAFGTIKVDTLYCMSSCSGHGVCNNLTKDCICDDFWMPNLVHMVISGGIKNDCSWPIIVGWFFLLLICVIIAKGIQFLWSYEGEEASLDPILVQKLLNNGNHKEKSRLRGRLSPMLALITGKRRNSIKGILQDFDGNNLRNQRDKFNDKSDSYDEEYDEKSSLESKSSDE